MDRNPVAVPAEDPLSRAEVAGQLRSTAEFLIADRGQGPTEP